MPSGYEVSAPQLAKASGDVETAANETQQLVSKLRGDLEPLRDNWKGAASTAFQSLVQRYNDSSEALIKELHSISVKLSEAAKAYGHNEEEQAQSLSNVANQAPSGGGYSF